jgi:ABC-type transport system involved in multi-copper enzyme maturation permease subunit
MSATTAGPSAAVPPRAVARGRVTQGRVLQAEWTKLWSLRSTRWSLLAAVVAMAGLGVLICAVQMSRWSHLTLQERLDFKPIETSLGGVNLAQLAIGVLGVLIISGEYSTGMIRSSVMAVPRRLPVLWAKIGVFSAVTFVLMLVSSLVAFLASQAILTSHHVNVGLGAPNALRAVVGTALFLTVLGILCVAIGSLVRNSAGGISAFVGVLFVLPGIVSILPNSLGRSIGPYLPSNAGAAITNAVPEPQLLAPWAGFGLFCGYTAVAVVAAAFMFLRRDV